MSYTDLQDNEKEIISNLTKINKQIQSGRVGFIAKYKFIEAVEQFLNELSQSSSSDFRQEAHLLIQKTIDILTHAKNTNLMSSLLYQQYAPLLEKSLLEQEITAKPSQHSFKI